MEDFFETRTSEVDGHMVAFFGVFDGTTLWLGIPMSSPCSIFLFKGFLLLDIELIIVRFSFCHTFLLYNIYPDSYCI